MRLVWVLATILLLFALLIGVVSARVGLRLISVPYQGLETLSQLASWGLQIINYQGDILAALASDAQIALLRRAGFQVNVLDWEAASEQYYLAYPAPGSTLDSLSWVEAVYPYGEEAHLIKATLAQAEALPARGVEIVKLPRAVILPRPQTAWGQSQSYLEYSPAVQDMVNAVSPTLLIHHVCKLQDNDSLPYCNEVGTRYSYATAKLNEAAQYLYNALAALGLSVNYMPFVYSSAPMTNVVAELPGNGPDDNHIYIICAHYDSISNDRYNVAPGADDNASGSAAVLEAARILSRHSFQHTVRFVLFAGEEQGLIGSAYYAAQAYAHGDLIDGVINLDMIGYESVPPNDHIVEIHAGTDLASVALADALIQNIAEYGVQLAPQKITSGATNRSDHASFWFFGYPAILGIEDFDDLNPYYHKTTDTLAHMVTALMVEFTKASVATLAELAVPIESATPTATPTPSFKLYLPVMLRG
jgi:hypothetical protein